eukprot:PLAT5310.1.p1 GENE.PLAT5310.1~~PLAT5310.1.p1  ORF type:complete len:446 (-),score=143.71 PLAT5310.1:14-1351(-)
MSGGRAAFAENDMEIGAQGSRSSRNAAAPLAARASGSEIPTVSCCQWCTVHQRWCISWQRSYQRYPTLLTKKSMSTEVIPIDTGAAAAAAGAEEAASSGKASEAAATPVEAGRIALGKLIRHTERFWKLGCLLWLIPDLLYFALAYLLWQTDQPFAAAAVVAHSVLWVAVHVAYALASPVEAYRKLKPFDTAVTACPSLLQDANKGGIAITILFDPTWIAFHVTDFTLPARGQVSDAVIALALLGACVHPILNLATYRVYMAPNVLFGMLLAQTEGVASAIRNGEPAAAVADKLAALQPLYDVSKPLAAASVFMFIAFILNGFVMLASVLLSSPVQPFFVQFLLLSMAWIFTTRLPAADCMSTLSRLPHELAMHRLCKPPPAAASEQEEAAEERALMHLVHMAKDARFGWYAGDLPVTSGLILRVKTVVAPILAFAAREMWGARA